MIPHRTSDLPNSIAFLLENRTLNPQIDKKRPVLKMLSGPRFARSGRPPLWGGGVALMGLIIHRCVADLHSWMRLAKGLFLPKDCAGHDQAPWLTIVRFRARSGLRRKMQGFALKID